MAFRDNDKAARALADLHMCKDEASVRKRHKISAVSLWRYKQALETETELKELFQFYLQAGITKSWADDLGEHLTHTMRVAREHIDHLPKASADSLKAINEHLKIVGDLRITVDALADDDSDDSQGRAPQENEARVPATAQA